MVRTFLKVYMEIGSSFLFLQEQIKDIIIIMYNFYFINLLPTWFNDCTYLCYLDGEIDTPCLSRALGFDHLPLYE
jgi:hypothetical protein